MDEILTAVQQVLEHERHRSRLFATLCMMSIAPDRAHGKIHMAGHPPPLLITQDGLVELHAPVCLPLGIAPAADWPSADLQLGPAWSVMLYTDGLIEGKIGAGPERLGSEGLIRMIEKARAEGSRKAGPNPLDDEGLIDSVVSQARELNGGDLDDDLAVMVISCSAPTGP
jgi:serine phosphatase RsbU (regulator of sigma subunit)